jgi:hypothetical protein
MPKKKRTWTAEQKQAARDRYIARMEAKKEEENQQYEDAYLLNGLSVGEMPPVVEVSPPDDSAQENTKTDDVAALWAYIKELESRQFFQQAPPVQQTAQVTSQGIVGTTVKYNDPKSYPDPRDRLFQEPRLTIQGFNRDWWDLEWAVSAFRWQGKDNLWFSEPKFDLQLIRIVPDEEGMPSKRRYVLHKVTLFEDPDAAMQVANQYGLEVPEHLEQAFLDEMRYLRIRDWVLESFYPPKPTQQKMNKVETVIGNKLVEVYEINSAESTEVPFQNLDKKL